MGDSQEGVTPRARQPTARASCVLWCRTCGNDFVVVGQRRKDVSATPGSETIFCPSCGAPRKMMLPPDVEGPITGVYTVAQWSKGEGSSRG
jgi:hypothetical protein